MPAPSEWCENLSVNPSAVGCYAAGFEAALDLSQKSGCGADFLVQKMSPNLAAEDIRATLSRSKQAHVVSTSAVSGSKKAGSAK
jgi:hypothetical protein